MTPTNRNIEASHLDDSFFISGPFINYQLVPGTAFARITGAGRQPVGGIKIMQSQGMPILPMSITDAVEAASGVSEVADAVQQAITQKYLDFSGEEPVLKPRPIVDWGFDRDEVLAREEATLANLPPCSVRFTGPVSGVQEHTEAGDFVIGFTTPGTYTLEFEAFPYQSATMELTVKPRETKQIDLGGIRL